VTAETLEPIQVVQKLDETASKLEKRGQDLAKIRRKLEPIQAKYDEHMEGFVAGLWDQYAKGEIRSFPGEDVRRALAHKDLDVKLRGEYVSLKDQERRCRDTIDRLKESIGAYRSILSAQKEGLV
jgi:phytoene dehydrogenase-like protein